MNVNRVKGGRGHLPFKPFRMASKERALPPIRLMGKIHTLVPPEEIISVPPWGLVVPAEHLEESTCSFYAEMDADSIPYGATVTLHFVPADDWGRQEVTLEYFGPEPLISIQLPNAWFGPGLGKHIDIHYDVEWPDGTRLSGGDISVSVTPFVEVAPVLYDGLELGQPLQPELFPGGLVARLQRVPNLLPYHDPVFIFYVYGGRNGFWHGFEHRYPLSDLGDGEVSVAIDPSVYSGYYEQGFTDVYITSQLSIQTIPLPTGWRWNFRVGGMNVLPPLPR